jgi:hypothetical protein
MGTLWLQASEKSECDELELAWLHERRRQILEQCCAHTPHHYQQCAEHLAEKLHTYRYLASSSATLPAREVILVLVGYSAQSMRTITHSHVVCVYCI